MKLLNLMVDNTEKVYRMIFFAVLFVVIPSQINYWTLYFSDRSDYFNYTELVVPKDSVNTDSKGIKVYSYVVVEKDVKLRYKDILRCDDGGGFEFTDSNESSGIIKAGIYPKMLVNEEGELIPVPWRFSVDANLIAGEKCRIDSTITAMPGHEFEFSQEISSNTFIVQ